MWQEYQTLVRENTLRPDDKVAKKIFKLRPVLDRRCSTVGGSKKRSVRRVSTKKRKTMKTKHTKSKKSKRRTRKK